MRRLFAFGALFGLAFSASAVAAPLTTNPGLAPIIVYVTETDKGIKYTMWQSLVQEGTQTLIVASGLQRGEVVTFNVSNKGKKPHNFAVFGKKTRTLRPGAKASFKIALLHRGSFQFKSTLDKGNHAFLGTLKVN